MASNSIRYTLQCRDDRFGLVIWFTTPEQYGIGAAWSADYPLKARRLDHVATLWEKLAARIKIELA